MIAVIYDDSDTIIDSIEVKNYFEADDLRVQLPLGYWCEVRSGNQIKARSWATVERNIADKVETQSLERL